MDDWPECPCQMCNVVTWTPGEPTPRLRFTMCPICGNKRCPKGTDHRLDCTDSNAPGQPGSSYANFWPDADQQASEGSDEQERTAD